ncbi:hypothetical protein PCK2_000856 [Pneumocystis canis]|nr:hypothetical protein PCK2_000856 [Pneumocystis canis]
MPIVKVFNAQSYECQRFNNLILKSSRSVRRWRKIYAIQQGLVRFVVLSMFIQGFWYGSHLVISKEVSAGNVLTVFWACLMAAFSIQTIIRYLACIEEGKISGFDLQNAFKEKTNEQPFNSHNYFYPEKCNGSVIYDSVSFSYPLRPEKMILKNVSMIFPEGKTTFIVGASGSGKSTLAALLIRIYETNTGSIYIDNIDIKLLDVNWIRNNLLLDISLWNILKDNWKYVNKKVFFILGLLSCVGNGIATPFFSYTLSRLLALFFSSKNVSEIKKESLKWSITILGVSFFDSLTLYFKILFFQFSSDYMITNIRSKLYKNTLLQKISDCSEKEFSSKNIIRIIINESDSMRSIFESLIGNILVAVIMVFLGVIWSFVIAWKLTIITVIMLPLLYLSIQYHSYINNRWESKYKEENNNASFILHEFTGNIFTIKALLLNSFFEQKFISSVEKVFTKGIRKAIYIGFGYGVMGSSIYLFKALLFYYGTKFILKKVYTPTTILIVFSLIMFSIITASQCLSMVKVPYYGKIKKASDDVNTLFNTTKENAEDQGTLTVPLNGEIIFKNVFFSYYGYSNVQVLKNIDLEIKNNEKIALVGRSDVRKAAQKAAIDGFMMQLPDGYDTLLTDYGKGLSTGQAQRISLARAFMRKPRILILDECTSALDPLCALSIQNIIKDLTNMTVIIVTHSKKMMKLADKIVLLKDGQITEIGTYDELMNMKKDFWTLIKKGQWT